MTRLLLLAPTPGKSPFNTKTSYESLPTVLPSIEHLPFRRVNDSYINGPSTLLVHGLSRNVFIALSVLVPNPDVSHSAFRDLRIRKRMVSDLECYAHGYTSTMIEKWGSVGGLF